MREIKFRGKRIDNNKWTYGYLFNIWDKSYILWGTTNGIPNMVEVDPKTVGQYTGLKDKNGKEIYEGDIVRYADSKKYLANKPVIKIIEWESKSIYQGFSVGDRTMFEIIGNIYENSNLLNK